MPFRFFEQLVDPFPPTTPDRSPRSVYRFCRHYARGLEPWLLLLAVFSTAIAIVEVSLFSVLADVIDLLGNSSPDDVRTGEGRELLWLALGILAAYPTLIGLQSLLLHQTLMGNLPMIVRWLAHRYLLRQSLSFFHDEFAGRIATRVMQTALAVRQTVIKLLDIMVYVVVYFVSVLVLFAGIDLRLALPMAVWLVLYVAILSVVLPRLQRVSERQADARALMTGRVADSYTNIATVKLFSHARRESSYAREGMEEFLGTVHPQMRLVTIMDTAVILNNALMVLAVGATALYLWLNGAITPGAIAAAIGLCLRVTGISEWIMWEVSDLFENLGTVQDGMATLSSPIAVQDAPGATPLAVRAGHLAFRNVDFSYGEGKTVFEGLDLDIPAGSKLGLIGRSGAGKSTLVNLLLRFYDVNSGAIEIDGQDVRSVTQESLRASIGMVTQDTSLLHRTVRENILYGREDATEDELMSAIQRAKAWDFIQSLEDAKGNRGLDAMVGERGVKLSGGQRQRIAIARVILKDAPILILDEATSALDSEVEVAIQESLYELMEGKTVLAIAHRLSTIAALDKLVVLEQGRVVETGSHDELLAQEGIYKRLWDYQSGGFLAPD
ncbi:ABC transporter ATP-binding protein [Pseudohaliea rubra]|uniref:Lipid A export ATP-binding protein/permease protein MsbA n=1 Tax=Pseudohaliea rubra DSM 19751 TaxID=1265313 RepID=A0A095XXC3_9GAMM|nr:ABC transporter ATP-binding protein [Pseudohaliea rubra]KGE04371.1 Lipid A export ATP-binding protein/permease protein MsbA [Pseudohaliea rubra DSM 19751]